ncbi:MAG: hypothetical protein GXP09_00140 [Gammaproteobacteria bacterium]|nr:hypothetical protein [Gammaproteobacteria bacterium]
MQQLLTKLLLLAVISGFSLLGSQNSWAGDKPTLLKCRSNAKTNRDFLFNRLQWVDAKDKPAVTFITHLDDLTMELRDKVFARIDTDKPTVRSIARGRLFGDKDEFIDFKGTVISRTDDMLVIGWQNPQRNKLWTAAIQLKNEIAIVTQYYNGMTSFGVTVETLTCR